MNGRSLARTDLEDRAIGELVRLERHRRGLRQSDLAAAAGVKRQTVSLVEHGLLAPLPVRTVRAVALAAGVQLPFAARHDGAAADRFRDAGHAQLVEAVTARLRDRGWSVRIEYTFNHYGDRGSVDVLGWHEATRTLLIVEVKTRLTDLQALLRSLDVKERIVPRLVRADLGWQARCVAVVLVLPADRTERRIVARHGALFEAALPARTVEVRSWVATPRGAIRGIWFLAHRDDGSAAQRGARR